MRGTSQFDGTNSRVFTSKKIGETTNSYERNDRRWPPNRDAFTSAPTKTFGSAWNDETNSNSSNWNNPTNDRYKIFNTLNSRPVDYASKTPLKKDFYQEHHAVRRRDPKEVAEFIAENDVTLDGVNIPQPVLQFSECQYPEPMEKLLYDHYKNPTVIQSITWPVALSGRDLIGIAQTGSGKTLGFLLPGIVHTLHQIHVAPLARGDGPIVLILLPTRELAQQVEVVARDYCKVMGLELQCLFGGAAKGPQAYAMKKGVHICVATPGRLLDFLDSDTTNLRRCSYLVLDEADRMLDMGFEPQIRRIINQIRPDRQTLMFSATWPQDVRALAKDFQTDAVFLNVGSLDLNANHNIEQIVEVITEYNKRNRLYQILEQNMGLSENKTIVFCETKRKTDDLTRILRQAGIAALCIHGDKEQAERDWVMEEFREGRTPILIATDVAARGLDVRDVKFVINFDYPNNSEDYVHRIGRTGRQNKKGTAYTFFTEANAPKAKDLIKVMEEAHQKVPAELIQLASGNNFANAQTFGRPVRGRGGRASSYAVNNRFDGISDSRGASTGYNNWSRGGGYNRRGGGSTTRGYSGGARGYSQAPSYGNGSYASDSSYTSNPRAANKLGWSHWDS